jgi:hypothetical protein
MVQQLQKHLAFYFASNNKLKYTKRKFGINMLPL